MSEILLLEFAYELVFPFWKSELGLAFFIPTILLVLIAGTRTELSCKNFCQRIEDSTLTALAVKIISLLSCCCRFILN